MLTMRISAAFLIPFQLTGTEIAITVSVGVAFAGPGERISDELLVKADLAMYRAKRTGGGSKVIDLRDALEATMSETFEHDLRTALTNGHLDVAYQPIVRSTDGLITGVEALLRWNDPDRGAVPAALMVAAAERSDLILDIGRWLLERACEDRSRWLRDHPGTTLDLSVNISARQLMTPGLSASVARVLTQTGTDAATLILEMTESVFIADAERTMMVLQDLSDLGVRLALDDFGTGYSSLNYLTQFPVNIVKIDRSFIANIGRSPKDVAVTAAMTDLAHVLELAVIAEGVESEHQHEAVKAVGCESAQGYYFARPMPASEISAILAEPHRRTHLPSVRQTEAGTIDETAQP
jgi:EAL domain-containing protein (putative c-di-GMP-specific phosphodiesterase class I)